MRITSALDCPPVIFCPFDWAVVRQSQRLLQLLSQSHLSVDAAQDHYPGTDNELQQLQNEGSEDNR